VERCPFLVLENVSSNRVLLRPVVSIWILIICRGITARMKDTMRSVNDYLRRASVYIFDGCVCEWSTLIYIKYVIVQICGMNGHYQTPLRIVLIFLKMYEKGEDC